MACPAQRQQVARIKNRGQQCKKDTQPVIGRLGGPVRQYHHGESDKPERNGYDEVPAELLLEIHQADESENEDLEVRQQCRHPGADIENTLMPDAEVECEKDAGSEKSDESLTAAEQAFALDPDQGRQDYPADKAAIERRRGRPDGDQFHKHG